MIKSYSSVVTVKKLTFAVLVAVLMLVLSLVLLRLEVQAGWKASGQSGCGLFIDAVNGAEDGDTLIPLLAPRTSSGATITKNVIIQGGWAVPPSGGCDVPNQTFTTTADLLAAGFTFNAPLSRSTLVYNLGPVISIAPPVISLTVQHINFEQTGDTTIQGGGISGVISNETTVRLENIIITNSTVVSRGAGIYLEVRGGSRLVISDSQFISNTATQEGGGGFEIHVYDNSEVIIYNTQVASNTAAGHGGGGRIVVESGYVTVTDSIFEGNQAATGNGLSIESIGDGPVQVWLNDNEFNGQRLPESGDLDVSGNGLNLAGNNFHTVFLPSILKNFPLARITDITLAGGCYAVEFETTGFVPQFLPGQQHLHFFLNTVPPEEAGVPGSGPWKLYPATEGAPAPSPFTGYCQSEKPAAATQMCVLIANYDHSVQLGTGNCFNLP